MNDEYVSLSESSYTGNYYTVVETTDKYKALMKRLYETSEYSGCVVIKNGVMIEPLEKLNHTTPVGSLVSFCFTNDIKLSMSTLVMSCELNSADVETLATLGVAKVVILVDKKNTDEHIINLLVNKAIDVEYVLTTDILDTTKEGENDNV